MSEKDKMFLNAFALVPEIGSATLFKIEKLFKSDFEKAWHAPLSAFNKLRLSTAQQDSLKRRLNINPQKEWQRLEKEGVHFITIHEKLYPAQLCQIPNPPYHLYIRGALPKNQNRFAVVGTRLATEYGKKVTQYIASELAAAGFIIVSGMAMGIDSMAHRAALDGEQPTIAVLGSGLDKKSVFPQINWNLSLRISQNGAVISEYPLGTGGTKEKFPQRNRIISGLSRGVLVVEAAEKSGSLITARLGLEQNRDVFAVPGSVFWPKSKGTNWLIKTGAKPVTNAQDILEEYPEFHPEKKTRTIVSVTPEEAGILANLNNEPRHIEELASLAKMDIAQTVATLTTMEIEGKVKNIGGDRFIAVD